METAMVYCGHSLSVELYEGSLQKRREARLLDLAVCATERRAQHVGPVV